MGSVQNILLPFSPPPGGEHDALREATTIKAVRDLKDALRPIQVLLDGMSRWQIEALNGNYEVISRPFGSGGDPAATAGPWAPYIKEYTSDDQSTALVWIRQGRIYLNPDDIDEYLTFNDDIDYIDDPITTTANTKCWLETQFSPEGIVDNCKLMSGTAWPFSGKFYQFSGGGNSWVTPIFHVVSPNTGKSDGLPDAPFADLGFTPNLGTRYIERLAFTHFRKEQRCLDTGVGLLWTLVPL